MSTPLHRLAGQARRRHWGLVLLAGLPWSMALAVLVWRMSGMQAAVLVAGSGLLLCCGVAVLQARRFDTGWATRRLDAARADMDDSSGLLLAPSSGLGPLQQLQQARLRERLRLRPPAGLMPAWPWRRLVLSAVIATLLAAAAVLWPSQLRSSPAPAAAQAVAPVVRAPGVVAQRLAWRAPDYTGVAPGEQERLDARLPQGSRLAWRFRFDPQPSSAALVFVDGSRLALQQGDDDGWQAELLLRSAALYRLEIDGAIADPAAAPHRLEVIVDASPQIQVIEPERSPVLVAAGQRRWAPVFEASDDYGLVGNAQLRITLAQGSGENVAFSERSIALAGQGDVTRRRYRADLDLAALNMGAGDDLVVQLEVRDNRSPQPQSTRSASVILRWPAHLDAAAEGLELLQRSVLPAYFRSQRQIIIDAEALQADKPRVDGERFLARSDAIGVDQRILRLRYGQFLGEEAEGAPKPPPRRAEADGDGEHAAHDDHPHDEAGPDTAVAAPPHDHAHDHAAGPDDSGPGFGRESDVLAEYGHTHDHAEAATLLDPETRATLKQALDQMWQSELQLRQGRPDAALPFAHRALEFIKQVQQAERVFLARIGPELPPIDESRRLGGKRDGIARSAWTVPALDRTETAPVQAAWQALAADAAPSTLDADALQRWIDAHRDQIGQPLDLLAALDSVRLQPDCQPCRRELRARLWSVLQRPPAGTAPRAPVDAQGARYLRALQEAPR